MRTLIAVASVIGALFLGLIVFGGSNVTPVFANTPVPPTVVPPTQVPPTQVPPVATPVPPTQCGPGTVLVNGVCQPVRPCGPNSQLVNGVCQQFCGFGSVLQFGVCVPVHRDPPISCPAPNYLVPQANLNQNLYGTIYGNYGVGSYLAGGNVLWNGQVVPNFYNQGWNGHGINYNPGFNGYVTTVSYACVAPPAAPVPTPNTVYIPVPAAPAPAPIVQAPAPRTIFISPPKTGNAGLISE